MSYLPPKLTTLADVVAGAADAPALTLCGGGPTLTRGALAAAVHAAAAGLRALGVGPGSVVSIVDVNTVDFVVAFLAVTLARAVAAPLNPAYKQDEFAFYLDDAKSSLLLVPAAPGAAAAARAAADAAAVPVAAVAVTWTQAAGVTAAVTPLAGRLRPLPADAAAVAALAGPADPPRPSDVALFLHTSGTTSRPKGVPLTHANLVASLANICATYELRPDDCSYLVMPLFHVHGLMAGLLSPLAARSRVALPAGGKFAAGPFWADIAAARATWYTAVPTMHQILLARGPAERAAAGSPRLRFIRSCSSALAPATLEKVEAAFGAPVLEAYAMTEAAHQMTSNPLPAHGPRKPGTVGPPQGGVAVAILAPDGRRLPPGDVGEVCIRGANVTPGYANNPAANKDAFEHGWFHTGDQGFLDADGYVTLTGRLKELINRGGEKISPLEVDAALLSHPAVAEAVSFGAPDEKYGEAVAAAIVLAQGATGGPDTEASIKAHAATKLAAFKVPTRIFITDVLPKTATGKIQRRFMVDAFCKPGGQGAAAPPTAAVTPAAAAAPSPSPSAPPPNGYAAVAAALAGAGVTLMVGVVGIPVTELASAAQAAGIRYLGFRNEQAAGYAAAAAGFLTRRPAALLTVSGPGLVHALAGAAHAQANCWPLLILSGSAHAAEVARGGGGGFQELDQVAAAAPYCKHAARLESAAAAGATIAAAVKAATRGRPGAAYIDLPADVLMGDASQADVEAARGGGGVAPPASSSSAPAPRDGDDPVDSAALAAALQLLRGAARPLIVIGKGAAYGRGEAGLTRLVDAAALPFIATSMGRGTVPDDHRLCVSAARSAALRGADVAVVFGARLNWQLHFGDPPKWAAGVKFVLIDPAPTPRDAAKAAVVLRTDAGAAAAALAAGLAAAGAAPPAWGEWTTRLTAAAAAARAKLDARLAVSASHPLDYWTAMAAIRVALSKTSPAPVVISEGANTMDMARLTLGPVLEPRLRIDAGTWGTMGVGLGAAAAAAAVGGGRRAVAIEGDSALGFSLAELETIARYGLPVTVIVFNNGGVYGGDRRPAALAAAAAAGAAAGGFAADPPPTAFVPDARHDLVMAAFGGAGLRVASQAELAAALQRALAPGAPPALIDVVIDPGAGVESGSVHAFNAPPATDSKL